jgi:MFS family permease
MRLTLAFADNVGVTQPNGVALVSIMNGKLQLFVPVLMTAASVPGNAIVGWLSDHVRTKIMMVAVCTIGAIATLIAWGFGTSVAPLVIFCIVWGMTSLCFVSLWSKIITRICKDDPTLPVLVFSVFAVLRGVGNVTSGPVSTRLLQTGVFKGAAGAFGSTNFVSTRADGVADPRVPSSSILLPRPSSAESLASSSQHELTLASAVRIYMHVMNTKESVTTRTTRGMTR